ncbi:hypothetical protein MNBD_GAMMA22-2840 [hydrothermal vent metagenome]|uniref:RNA polymerase sigma-70 region 2 domain-containing protein n=1 Tax=hydrothermal vent metagenome TaxID=652676 RepID=A0A3B1AL31_9ZZZZ
MKGIEFKSSGEVMKDEPQSSQLSQPEQWLNDHGDYLFNFAIQKLKNPAHAEDVVQETLLSALIASKKESQYLGKSSEKTWLTGILNHKIIDFIRKQVRELTIEDIVALSDSNMENGIDNLFDSRGRWLNPPQKWGNPEELLHNRQFLTTLNHCLSKLNPTMTQIFSMKEISGKTPKEICNKLDITPANFNVIFYRIRMKLRQCIEHIWDKK